MSDQPAADQVVVPIKVSQPEEGAPPTLAQPASGPVAEMSGAIHKDAPKPAEPADNTTADASTAVNGAAAQSSTEDTTVKSSEEKPVADESTPAVTENPATEEPAAAADADTEMTDAAPTTATETNGTPAAKPQPKRKSSTGVPEHKSKTLKKKQSKAKITNLDAKPGDLFLARLRSYPPWPSIISDEDMLPDVLLTTRPVTAKKADGTYNEAYAEGGKKVVDRTYPVMFLHTNEFAWIPNTDLSPITPEECANVPEKGKAKALVEGYKVAAEGHDLEHFKEILLAHDAALQEDNVAKAEKEAEKAANKEKKKRKSEANVAEDVEMADATEPAKKSSKKRKKNNAESEDEEQPEKPPKTPRPATGPGPKIKLSTAKTPTTDKKTEKKTPKPKSEKKKKTADSEEDAEPEKEAAPPVDPVQDRKDREKEVLFHRHKLQKGFLTRDQMPAESEMPQMAIYFKKLEAYGDKLEVSIIRSTKINKVLKGIVKLNTIPRDEEFNFRERSVKLLGIWNQLLGADPSDEKPVKDDNASPGAANGVSKDADEKTEEKAETALEPAATETEKNTLSTEEAVNKISAEVPADAGAKAAAIDAVSKDDQPTEEPPKIQSADIPGTEKAPESAEAAAEAAEVVKATE